MKVIDIKESDANDGGWWKGEDRFELCEDGRSVVVEFTQTEVEVLSSVAPFDRGFVFAARQAVDRLT